jgi:hypothetical protein
MQAELDKKRIAAMEQERRTFRASMADWRDRDDGAVDCRNRPELEGDDVPRERGSSASPELEDIGLTLYKQRCRIVKVGTPDSDETRIMQNYGERRTGDWEKIDCSICANMFLGDLLLTLSPEQADWRELIRVCLPCARNETQAAKGKFFEIKFFGVADPDCGHTGIASERLPALGNEYHIYGAATDLPCELLTQQSLMAPTADKIWWEEGQRCRNVFMADEIDEAKILTAWKRLCGAHWSRGASLSWIGPSEHAHGFSPRSTPMNARFH